MATLVDPIATSPTFARPITTPPAAGDPTGLSAYHPSWPARFRVEAEVVRAALVALAPRFEHVGSTAVTGMTARPIVDVLLGVRDPAEIDDYASRLNNFGYQLASGTDAEATSPFASRLLIRSVRGVRTHHVYVVEYLGERWQRFVLFRDALRVDRTLAGEYEALRQRLALDHAGNRPAHARAKAAFVQRTLGIEVD